MPEVLELIKEIKSEIDTQQRAFTDHKATIDELIDKEKKNEGGQAELKERLDKIEPDLNKAEELKAQVEQLEVAFKRMFEESDRQEGKIRLDDQQKEWKEALIRHMRTGSKDELETLSLKFDRKDLSVGKNPDGGYWVTPDMSGRMVQQIFESSPLRSVASSQTISTDKLEGSYDDDEYDADWTGERSGRPKTATAEIGRYSIPVHEMYAAPLISQKLIEDSSVDPEAHATRKIGEKFARVEALAFVLGNGAHRPKGFLDYEASAVADVYERGTIGQVIGQSPDSGKLIFEDIYDLFYSLKDNWSQNGRFAASRLTFSEIRKLKDDQGRFLWEPSTQVGQPALLVSAPTIQFNDMPNVASDTLSLAFADWAAAYQIVDRISFSLLVDPFSNKPDVEFYARRRVGGQVLGFDAIKLLKTKT